MWQHTRTSLRILTLTIFLGASVAVLLAQPGLSHAEGRELRLTGGAPSIDTLLDQFLAALAARDEQALRRLRVTETEYREIIIPGTVKPGEPLRQVAEQPSQFFWSMLNQRSEDVSRVILKKWGGHRYIRKALRFTRGSRQFASYTAHGDVRLDVEDEHHDGDELRAGAIAEVAGRYKFISFYSNN